MVLMSMPSTVSQACKVPADKASGSPLAKPSPSMAAIRREAKTAANVVREVVGDAVMVSNLASVYAAPNWRPHEHPVACKPSCPLSARDIPAALAPSS